VRSFGPASSQLEQLHPTATPDLGDRIASDVSLGGKSSVSFLSVSRPSAPGIMSCRSTRQPLESDPTSSGRSGPACRDSISPAHQVFQQPSHRRKRRKIAPESSVFAFSLRFQSNYQRIAIGTWLGNLKGFVRSYLRCRCSISTPRSPRSHRIAVIPIHLSFEIYAVMRGSLRMGSDDSRFGRYGGETWKLRSRTLHQSRWVGYNTMDRDKSFVHMQEPSNKKSHRLPKQ
jgi:hypothetical protein